MVLFILKTKVCMSFGDPLGPTPQSTCFGRSLPHPQGGGRHDPGISQSSRPVLSALGSAMGVWPHLSQGGQALTPGVRTGTEAGTQAQRQGHRPAAGAAHQRTNGAASPTGERANREQAGAG